jgi:hypothetical protein
MKMVLLSRLEAFGLNLQVFHRILVKSRKRVQKSEEKKKKKTTFGCSNKTHMLSNFET